MRGVSAGCLLNQLMGWYAWSAGMLKLRLEHGTRPAHTLSATDKKGSGVVLGCRAR